MPKNPNRPKLRYKPGYDKNGVKRLKPPPERKTKEEIAAKQLAKLEKRYGVTPAKVSVLILKERGLLTSVCRSLKIPRTTLLRYIEKHDECLEALNQAREAMGDKAEAKLFELIEAGDVRCILYYLSTVHRARGYGLAAAAGSPDDPAVRGPVFVETVNIVGVPSGTFIPKETPPVPVIEHQ